MGYSIICDKWVEYGLPIGRLKRHKTNTDQEMKTSEGGEKKEVVNF